MSNTMEQTQALITSHILVLQSIPQEVSGHIKEIDLAMVEINALKAKIAERYRTIQRHEKELDALDAMQRTVTKELAGLYAESIATAKGSYSKAGRYITVLDLENMIDTQV